MVLLVQEYFTRSAERTPDKRAVSCKDDSASFKELESTSNVLARALQNQGVARGSFVPIFLPKGVDAIRSILAILKADSAYVPLDMHSPRERLLNILEATASDVILVSSACKAKLEDILGEARHRYRLLNVSDTFSESDRPLVYENLSIDIAYVLFTSGSTGVPKGVMISHQMILDYIEWCVDTYDLRPDDIVANHAPLYFDNSTFDLYTAFKVGAELHLVNDELNVVMHKLISWIEERNITVFFCVPSVLTILLKSGRVKEGRFPALRHVIAAGEVLPPDVVRGWMLAVPHAQFTNMYGPTEITVDCTFHVIPTPPDEGEAAVPIGRPRRNMEVFLRLDDGRLSKSPGVVGEIAVRGKSVAYGYLSNPEKTAQAFIQNPAHNLYHDPIYLTGDLAKLDKDGKFFYIGRKDHQIKYMGNRIELGEIEAAFRDCSGVSEAVVVFNDDHRHEHKAIGALVALHDGASLDDVTGALKRKLPAYMVPRRVIETDGLPHSPNGKVDRLAALRIVFP